MRNFEICIFCWKLIYFQIQDIFQIKNQPLVKSSFYDNFYKQFSKSSFTQLYSNQLSYTKLMPQYNSNISLWNAIQNWWLSAAANTSKIHFLLKAVDSHYW